MLHTVGLIYTQKATTCLKSSKFFGLGGVWFRTKEKSTLVKSAWGTMSSAVDASIAGTFYFPKKFANISKAEKMSKMEEEGAAKWTEEQLAESMLEFSGSFVIMNLMADY